MITPSLSSKDRRERERERSAGRLGEWGKKRDSSRNGARERAKAPPLVARRGDASRLPGARTRGSLFRATFSAAARDFGHEFVAVLEGISLLERGRTGADERVVFFFSQANCRCCKVRQFFFRPKISSEQASSLFFLLAKQGIRTRSFSPFPTKNMAHDGCQTPAWYGQAFSYLPKTHRAEPHQAPPSAASAFAAAVSTSGGYRSLQAPSTSSGAAAQGYAAEDALRMARTGTWDGPAPRGRGEKAAPVEPAKVRNTISLVDFFRCRSVVVVAEKRGKPPLFQPRNRFRRRRHRHHTQKPPQTARPGLQDREERQPRGRAQAPAALRPPARRRRGGRRRVLAAVAAPQRRRRR